MEKNRGRVRGGWGWGKDRMGGRRGREGGRQGEEAGRQIGREKRHGGWAGEEARRVGRRRGREGGTGTAKGAHLVDRDGANDGVLVRVLEVLDLLLLDRDQLGQPGLERALHAAREGYENRGLGQQGVQC